MSTLYDIYLKFHGCMCHNHAFSTGLFEVEGPWLFDLLLRFLVILGGVGEVSQNQRSVFFGGNSSWKTKPKVRKTAKKYKLILEVRSIPSAPCIWNIMKYTLKYVVDSEPQTRGMTLTAWQSVIQWFSRWMLKVFFSFKMNRLNWHYRSKFDAFQNEIKDLRCFGFSKKLL